MALVERSVLASVGGTPSRPMVSVSAGPSCREPAAPGCDLSRSRANASRVAWALRRGGVVVGGRHLLGHAGGEEIGQVGLYVSNFVQLAALDDGVIEHRLYGRSSKVHDEAWM